MSGLSDRTRFFDILLPGSHDSGSFGFTDGDINLDLRKFVQTQDKHSNFSVQMEKGIRFLDLRVRKVGDALGDNLALFHGDGSILGVSKSFYLNQNLSDALTAAKRFLEKNPSETLVISIKQEEGPTESASSDITVDDIQAYITKYERNSSLPLGNNHLWVAGPSDFASIQNARNISALADLNTSQPLTTTNPRNPSSPAKLNYENLSLGDVRGRIILYLRGIPGYYDKQSGWARSSIVALDNGTYTGGVYSQDKYDAPEYDAKKRAIIDGAKGTYGSGLKDYQFSINFTSAASKGVNPRSSPASFALTINSGLEEYQFQTDDYTSRKIRSGSLKTLLSPGKLGTLYNWNIEQRSINRRGLNGAMAGDFMTTPQSWYNEFWSKTGYSRRGYIPNPNSNDYPASDHLTKLIWSQNTVITPNFKGATTDAITGIPVFPEEQTSTIEFNNYLTRDRGLKTKYRITELDVEQTGLSTDTRNTITVAPTSDSFQLTLIKESTKELESGLQSRPTKRVSFNDSNQKAGARIDQNTKGLSFQLDEQASDPLGYRFFQLDILVNNSPFAAPYHFAVADSELLA